MKEQPILEIKNINKTYKNGDKIQEVLRDINLSVEEGKVYCLLGYSGCGKTTLLRMVSALESADSGKIIVKGKEYSKPSKDVLLLFQDFNQLFSWKSILGNIVHALRITNKGMDKNSAIKEAEEILAEVGLYEFRHRYPQKLSGGMKQRAAVARALALKPQILLMDEPFASLDMVTRHNLQKLVREKCLKYGITVLFVTHGVEEAVIVGDTILIMKANPGEIGIRLENEYLKTGNSVDKMKIMSIIMEQLNSQIEQEAEANGDSIGE